MTDQFEIRPADGREPRTFDDPTEAAKFWRTFAGAAEVPELLLAGGKTPTSAQAGPVYEALEELNDELPKVVIFKDEDDCDGVPIGPVTVGPDPDLVVLLGEAVIRGKPWKPKCFCQKPNGEPGEICDDCGKEVPEPWLTLPQAEAKARELGLELRET